MPDNPDKDAPVFDPFDLNHGYENFSGIYLGVTTTNLPTGFASPVDLTPAMTEMS